MYALYFQYDEKDTLTVYTTSGIACTSEALKGYICFTFTEFPNGPNLTYRENSNSKE